MCRSAVVPQQQRGRVAEVPDPDGAVVPARGHLVVYEYQFNGGSAAVPFTLNSAHGDEIWLSQSDGDGRPTGLRAREEFRRGGQRRVVRAIPDQRGVDFVAQSRRTFGTNDPPADVGQFRLGAGVANALPRSVRR